MYCRYCGQYIAEDIDFCPLCGRSVLNKDKDTGTSTEELFIKSNASRGFFIEHLTLIVRALCYITLVIFLFFNIKMAPFHGWWKFLAYVVEAAVAIYLTVFTRDKISECQSFNIKIFSIVFSIFIIISSIMLRIVYEVKVDIAETDIPSCGEILVDISYDTDYYSYMGGLIYNPSTSVKINGASSTAKISLGGLTNLKIKVAGNHESGSTSDTLTLHSSYFVNGTYSFTKTVSIGRGISAIVKVKLRRYCTFWEVILY